MSLEKEFNFKGQGKPCPFLGERRRVVYMKKDKTAKDTGGWHYAAFDPDGKYLQKDVKKECYDCHTAVKDSDYIFSKFIE